ncbi:hypothetical protein V8C35DRAFT_314658, partial [Trichoderma chlorosporum]
MNRAWTKIAEYSKLAQVIWHYLFHPMAVVPVGAMPSADLPGFLHSTNNQSPIPNVVYGVILTVALFIHGLEVIARVTKTGLRGFQYGWFDLT